MTVVSLFRVLISEIFRVRAYILIRTERHTPGDILNSPFSLERNTLWFWNLKTGSCLLAQPPASRRKLALTVTWLSVNQCVNSWLWVGVLMPFYPRFTCKMETIVLYFTVVVRGKNMCLEERIHSKHSLSSNANCQMWIFWK